MKDWRAKGKSCPMCKEMIAIVGGATRPHKLRRRDVLNATSKIDGRMICTVCARAETVALMRRVPMSEVWPEFESDFRTAATMPAGSYCGTFATGGVYE